MAALMLKVAPDIAVRAEIGQFGPVLARRQLSDSEGANGGSLSRSLRCVDDIARHVRKSRLRRRRQRGRADGRGGTPKNPASSALVHTLYELVQYQITLEP
jgi:hypothetical protein